MTTTTTIITTTIMTTITTTIITTISTTITTTTSMTTAQERIRISNQIRLPANQGSGRRIEKYIEQKEQRNKKDAKRDQQQ